MATINDVIIGCGLLRWYAACDCEVAVRYGAPQTASACGRAAAVRLAQDTAPRSTTDLTRGIKHAPNGACVGGHPEIVDFLEPSRKLGTHQRLG